MEEPIECRSEAVLSAVGLRGWSSTFLVARIGHHAAHACCLEIATFYNLPMPFRSQHPQLTHYPGPEMLRWWLGCVVLLFFGSRA
jgi:hypothetical protein